MKRTVFLFILVLFVGLTGYHLLILYDNRFPLGRMWQTPAVRPHEEPLPVMPAGGVPAGGGEAGYRSLPPQDLKSPIRKATPRIIEQGRIGYADFCAACHGPDHDGNGTVGQSFYPLPTDLRSRKVQGASDGLLFQHLSYGVSGGRQPPLATTIRVEERWRIIAYIQSLGMRPPRRK